MRLPFLIRAATFAGAAALGAGAPPAALAAEQQPLLQTPLSQAPGRQLTAVRVTYAPGQSTPPHRHSGDAFVYVLAGRIRSQLAGGAVHVYGAGDSWFEPAGTPHRISGNASAHEPASMLVIFVAAPRAALTTLDQPMTAARTQSR